MDQDARREILQKYCLENDVASTPGVNVASWDTELSVVIPAFNEQNFIGDTIMKLGESDYPLEIIVVDDGSDDRTKEVVAEAAKQITYPVTVLENKNRGPVFARKRGMDEVTAQYLQHGSVEKNRYIAMTDADTLVPANWAREICKTFKNTQAWALGGQYRYPQRLDEIIEQATGLKDYFGYIPKIAYFLASHNAALIVTNGANAALEAVPYAAIGGSQQPRDEQGKPIKGSDWQFGTAVRAMGGRMAFLPVMTVTNARREIYALSKKSAQHNFSTMEGWVNCREQDYALLESIAQDLRAEDLIKHRNERAQSYVLRTVVLPVLTGQLDMEGLSALLGPTDPFMRVLQEAKTQAEGKSGAEIKSAALQMTKQYGSIFLNLAEKAINRTLK